MSHLYEIQIDDREAFEEEFATFADYCQSVCLDCGLCGCSRCDKGVCDPSRVERQGEVFENQLQWWRSRAFGTDNKVRAFEIKRLF